MNRKIAVTITTINVPQVVSSLIEQEIEEGDELEIVVVGDLKTPRAAEEFISTIYSNNSQIRISYLSVIDQEKRFTKYRQLWSHIPFNSFSRRNFGDLYCLLENHDYVIRIDDDNFPLNRNFIKDHLTALESPELLVVQNSSGWYNICELLDEERSRYFFPRGFPYKFRILEKVTAELTERMQTKVGINAGLWLGDPDIDAITRLVLAPYAVKLQMPSNCSNLALGFGTWSPINTQNTAYTREFLKCSFVSPFVGRYDDIFSGYILRAIMDHLEVNVTYGMPLVEQKRNPHDLWKDESLERFGNTSGVEIIEFLKDYQFIAKNPLICYGEVSQALRFTFSKIYPEIGLMCDGIDAWINAVMEI